MMIIALVTGLLLLIVWINVEFENGQWLFRMSLGLLTMVAMTVLGYSLARFSANVEGGANRNSLKVAEELMVKGENQRVQQAIHAYNQTASASQSTYKASFEMSYILYHGPRP